MSQKRSTAMRQNGAQRKDVTGGGAVYGGLIAHQRVRHGLTQRELAAKVQTSPSTIQSIEEGHPPDLQIQERLAAVFEGHSRSILRRAVSKVTPGMSRSHR